MLLVWTVITGMLYPLTVTGLSQLFFPKQANGSLMVDANAKIIGSELIGQAFSDPNYFWGRPSATSSFLCWIVSLTTSAKVWPWANCRNASFISVW